MLEAFVKFFVKWSETKGSGSSAKLRKHDLLMLERSYFQHFWAKNGLLWCMRLYLWDLKTLLRNIGWHKLKNTNPVEELGGLSGYWQPGLTATVLWMVENEQITSAISWTDNTEEGHHVLTVKHVMSVIWDWNEVSTKDFSDEITTFVSVALRQ